MKRRTAIAFLLFCSPVLLAGDLPPAEQAFHLRLSGQVDEAMTLLEETVKEHPDDTKAWFEMARTHWHQWPATRDFSDAAKAIDRACKLDPNDARLWLWAGNIYMYHAVAKAHHPKHMLGLPGAMKKSRKRLEKALVADPNCHEARELLYHLYDNNPWYLGGRKKKAKRLLKEMETRHPARAAVMRAGDIDFAKQQERLAVLEPFLTSHPQEAVVTEAVCKIHLRLGNLPKAEQYARTTIVLKPERRSLMVDIARAYQRKQGDLTKAEDWLKEYLADESLPNILRANGLGRLASVYEAQGHTSLAEETKAKAKQLDPYSNDAPLEKLDVFSVAP